jgi:hypothetical protein
MLEWTKLTISGRIEARITSGIGRVVCESVAMSESSVWTVTRGLAAAEAIARVFYRVCEMFVSEKWVYIC